MEAAAVTARLRAVTRTRGLALSAPVVLVALVGTSASVRFLLALFHPTPLLFADEYIYSTLAHELATTGRPTIRGEAAGFPALLQPILTAPFWLLGDAGIALRSTQALNAVAMSLAAVPVYLLGRKLGLHTWFTLAAAALTLLVPDLFYVPFVLGEPIAYPLVLGAVYAGVCARTGSRYAKERSPRSSCSAGARLVRPHPALAAPAAPHVPCCAWVPACVLLRLTLGAVRGLASTSVAVKGLGHECGVSNSALDPAELICWAGVDAMLLAYVPGWLDRPRRVASWRWRRCAARWEWCSRALIVPFCCGCLRRSRAIRSETRRPGPGVRFEERDTVQTLTLRPALVFARVAGAAWARAARRAGAGGAPVRRRPGASSRLAGPTSTVAQDSLLSIGVDRTRRGDGSFGSGSVPCRGDCRGSLCWRLSRSCCGRGSCSSLSGRDGRLVRRCWRRRVVV